MITGRGLAWGLILLCIVSLCVIGITHPWTKDHKSNPIRPKPKIVTTEQALNSPQGWGITSAAESWPPNLYIDFDATEREAIHPDDLGNATKAAWLYLGSDLKQTLTEMRTGGKKPRPYVRVIFVATNR